MATRWTIRGVDSRVIALVQSVSAESGETLGALVTEAVQFWFENLPKAAENPDLLELHKQLSDYNRLLEQFYRMLGQCGEKYGQLQDSKT